MAVSIGDIIGTIKLEDTFSPKLEVAARNVEAFAGKMDKLGSRVENVGRKLSLSLTLPIAAITGMAVKSATTLNESLANVSALLTDISGAELDRTVGSMKVKIQGLAHDMGKSTKDISEGLYEVISSLGNTADTFGQLEISAKAASAGLATTQEAFNLLSAVTKTYGDTSEEAFKKVADLAFQAVNIGQTTFPQLSAAIGGVAPLAQYAGVSLQELFAIIATATGVTGNTSEVTTQMASAISGLISPSKDLNELFREQGIASAQAAIAEKGLAGTLQMVVDYANRTGKPLADLLGRKEAIILAATLAGEQEEKFAETLNKMGDAWVANGRIVNDAQEKQTQGVNKAGFAWKQLQADAQIALEKLGDQLIPILLDIGQALRPIWESITKLIDTFAALPASVKASIIVFAGLLAAAGPILLVAGQLISTWATVAALFGTGGALAGALATIGPALGSIAAVITGPAGWIAAGIALLVAWKPTRDFIVDLAKTIYDVFVAAVKGAIEIATAWWDSIEDIRTPIAKLAGIVGDFAGVQLADYVSVIKTVISNFSVWARKTAEAIKFTFNFARAIREDLFAAIGGIISVVKTVIGWYVQYTLWVGKLTSRVADSIIVFLNWSGILPAVRAAVNIVISGLSILWTWLGKAKDKLFEWIEMVGGIVPVLAVLNPGLAASVALFTRWSDRAKELAEDNKDVAATQDEINKKVEQGAKLIPLPTSPKPKPKPKPEPPVLLTEDQKAALKAINDRIAAMDRERDAHAALLVALKQGPEAYLAERRAQEINNEIFDTRQELLQASLSLTPQLEAKIRRLTGSIFDSNTAAEKYDLVLSDLASSISALGSIQIPKLDSGGDQESVKQWAGSLADLRFELDNLRVNLQRLPKDSAEYRTALQVLTETEKRYQVQVSRLPEILADRKSARTSEIRSILSVAESVTRSIDEEIEQLGRGSAAWDAYSKSLEVKARAIQILGVFNLPKPDASDAAALAEWTKLFDEWKAQFAELSGKISLEIDAQAAADLRNSLKPAQQVFEEFAAEVSRYVGEGLLSEKDAAKILFRANELTGAMRDSFLGAAQDINTALADGLVEAAFEGKEAWDDLGESLEQILKRLIADWLSQWFQAMAQWLARWIATQAAARAASVAMGTGGGGGGGAGMYGGLFQMGSKAYSSYSSSTSTSQFASSAAGYALAAYALYVVYKGFVEKHTAEWAAVNLKTGVRTGDTAKVKATVQKRVDELRQQLRDISEMLEVDLQELGDVTLGKRGKGYYVQIGESIREGFATVEEAMDYARVAAIKFGTLGDQISDNVRQAIDKSLAKTMEEFQADIDLAKKIDNLKMGGEVAAQMAEIFRLRTQEILHAQALGLSIKELIEARKQEFDSIRNSLLGIDDSVAKHLKDLFSYQRGAEEAHSKLRNTFERILGTTIEEAEKFVKEYGDMLSGFTFVPGTGSNRPGKEDEGTGSQWLDAAGNAVDETTRAILGKVDRFKKALERYYEQLAALPEKLTEDQMRLGVFNQLFGFIESNARLAAKYEGQRAAFAKLQVDIQFKLIKLWLEAFGVFEEFAALYNDAYNAALQSAGRPSGRGGGGGVDRKEIRENLLDQIRGIEAELAGPLHVSFLQFSQALADFKEEAKKGKLSAADLARGIAALTEQFQRGLREQANAMAGIGTDFTRRLAAVKKFFDELRDLGRQNTGMPKWLVDFLEGKALSVLGKELNQAIAAFGGLSDPMLAITIQADALKENVLAFAKAAGWSAEQIEAAMGAIDRGVEFQRQQGINSALDRLFAWAKQAGILAKESLEHEREKALLDVTLIEAQFRFYGALTTQIEGWIGGIRNWINSAGFGAGGNGVQDVRVVNTTGTDWAEVIDKIKSLVENWRQAVKQFADSTASLLTDEGLTNLTQEEQLAFAKAQVEDLAAKARLGDAEALAKLDAARAEYIRELRESEGAGFGFDKGWDWVMGLTADVLENVQSAEEALIAKELAKNVQAWAYVMSQLANQLEAAFYSNTQDLIDAIYAAIAGVPGFAQGGIVMRGPRLVRVAENVAEAIVPLDRLMEAVPYSIQTSMRGNEEQLATASSMSAGSGSASVSVYDQSERFRQFQRQNDSTIRLAKIEESNRSMVVLMSRMQQDMSAMRRRV